MSTIASHLPPNISETVRDRGFVPMKHQWNDIRGIEWSRVTYDITDPERSSRDPNTLKAQYLETAEDAISNNHFH